MKDPEDSPKQLGEFEVLRRLGIGGMAEVFLAKRRGAEGTFKHLVLKRVLPAHTSSEKFRAMFAEEAQLATRLNHPNIVQVYEFQDYGEDGPLLSMEFVEGLDLRALLRECYEQKVRFPPWLAAFVIAEAARGLHYAHERSDESGAPLAIVHRDVSPQNLLLSFDGSVKVADFGIASANLFREEPGTLKGKTSYMSPEQARAESVDRRTDIYSLGVVLYQMLAGRLPHQNDDPQTLLELVRHRQARPPSDYTSDVPHELEALAMKALKPLKEDRFETARDFSIALSKAIFQSGHFIDAHTLEQFIHSMGFAPVANHPLSSSHHPIPTEDRDELHGAPSGHIAPTKKRREVRHVAVASIRISGLKLLSEKIPGNTFQRFCSQLIELTDSLAYRRGARLNWLDSELPTEAVAIIGLLANPTRAASDAASLALDINDCLEALSDTLPCSITASVSLIRATAEGHRNSSGHLESHELQGGVEALARALAERCPTQQIWVAGGLYRLLRRDFVWKESESINLQSLEFAEFPPTLRIHRLERPLSREERQRAAASGREVVGRDAELAELHAAFHQAVSSQEATSQGHFTTRAMVGEMGIGKSAIATAFLAEIPPDVRILRADCAPATREIALSNAGFWLRELTGVQLGQLFEEAADQIREALGDYGYGEESQRLIECLATVSLGQLRELRNQSEAELQQELLITGFRRFCARATIEGPFVFALDGIQWCDPASLAVLKGVISAADPLPVLTLLVTRSREALGPLLGSIVTIQIQGLSPAHQAALVEHHLGATIGVAKAIHPLLGRVGGNPFFLLELIDALLERGHFELREVNDGQLELLRMRDSNAPQEIDAALPETLEQLIADRLSELPPTERAIIDWLAVNGGPMREVRLIRLIGNHAEEAFTRLNARGLCDTKEGKLDVRSPLTRDVAYLALSDEQKSQMHRILGETLLTDPNSGKSATASIAAHLAKGNLYDLAAKQYLNAAIEARNSYQLELASTYYASSLELATKASALAPQDPQHLDMILECEGSLENLARALGNTEARLRYLEAFRTNAAHSKHPRWIGIAMLRTAQYLKNTGQIHRANECAGAVLNIAQNASLPELQVDALTLLTELQQRSGDVRSALELSELALSAARSAQIATRQRAELARARGELLLKVGKVEEAVQHHIEAVAAVRRVGARRHEAQARCSLALSLIYRGDFQDALVLAEEAIQLELTAGGRVGLSRSFTLEASALIRIGALDLAKQAIAQAEKHESVGVDAESWADLQIVQALLAIEEQNFSLSHQLTEKLLKHSRISEDSYLLVHAQLIQGWSSLLAQNNVEAVALAFEARQLAETHAYAGLHFHAMSVEAMARAILGEAHTASLLASTALSALETLDGSLYGLETRLLCLRALRHCNDGSTQRAETSIRNHFAMLEAKISQSQLKKRFHERWESRLRHATSA